MSSLHPSPRPLVWRFSMACTISDFWTGKKGWSREVFGNSTSSRSGETEGHGVEIEEESDKEWVAGPQPLYFIRLNYIQFKSYSSALIPAVGLWLWLHNCIKCCTLFAYMPYITKTKVYSSLSLSSTVIYFVLPTDGAFWNCMVIWQNDMIG